MTNISVDVTAQVESSAVNAVDKAIQEFLDNVDECMKELVNEHTTSAQAKYDVAVLLANSGVSTVNWQSEETVAPITVTNTQQNNEYVVTASGPDVAFVEFGTGVFHNGTEPYPIVRPAEVAPIGGYGSHKGRRTLWQYDDDNGLTHFTSGIPASAALYHGYEDAISGIDNIIEKVFK